jgi:hypothetical protein
MRDAIKQDAAMGGAVETGRVKGDGSGAGTEGRQLREGGSP